MKTFILLFQCADQKGIVAKISNFIFEYDGNIIIADQYSTDPEGGHFFLRVEFYIDETRHTKASIEAAFAPIADGFKARWQFYDTSRRQSMGILVSKPDHCLFDLLYLWKSGELAIDIPFVISNHPDHEGLVRQYGIPYYHIPVTGTDKKEAEILAIVKDADFLVLARYMQVLTGHFLAAYGRDIINIHHSFLPSFKGANPYEQAFERGVKVIGATAHFVTPELDTGPIITQIVEPVTHRDHVDDLVRKGKNLEKRALSQAIHLYSEYRVMRYKNRTVVFA